LYDVAPIDAVQLKDTDALPAVAVSVAGAAGTELAPEELELLEDEDELLLDELEEELDDEDELVPPDELELLLEDAPEEELPDELEELEEAGVVTLTVADLADKFPAAS